MSIEFILFLVLGIIVLSVIFLINNPKRFVMAMIIVMAGWQGGYWLSYFELDIRFSHILIVILFLYCLISHSKIRLKDRLAIGLLIPLSAMIICGSIAAFGAVNRGVALGGVFTFVLDYFLVVCIISTIEKPKDVIFLMNALLVALGCQIILTLLQYRIMGFKIGIIDQRSSHLVWWRMYGTFVHPNQFGMFLMFILPFVFRYLIIAAISRKRGLTIITVIIFLFGGFALYTTQNRGSQFAMVVGLLVTFIIDLFRKSMKTKKVLMRISVILLILIGIAMFRYGDRIYGQYFTQSSNIYEQFERRDILNQEAIPRVIASFPFGIGMSNYESEVYEGYMVHNLYLLIAAEIGVGIVFFIWILLYLVFKSIKLMRIKHIFLMNLGSACLATLIGFIISSWVGPDWFWADQVRMNFWILIGIIIGTGKLWNRMKDQQLHSS